MTRNKKLPTPERLARAAGDVDFVIVEDKERNETVSTIRMLDGSVLDMLVSRGAVTGDQYHAGARFYEDWYLSGLAASGVIDPTRVIVDGSGRTHTTERQLAAMTRYKDAVKALGMSHGIVMQCVVLAEEKLEEFGRRRYGYSQAKLAKTAAITALRDALDELDHHYNGPRKVRSRHTHATDYRPTKIVITPKA